MSDALSELHQLLGDFEESGLPPVHTWDPETCGEMDLEIHRDGSWWYQGTPIERKRLIKLFSRVLRKEGSDYYLVTPVEKLKIRVDDAPFLAVRMEQLETDAGLLLIFEDNCDNRVAAGAKHPLRVDIRPGTREPAPYIRIRNGLDALIARPLFYDLVTLATPRNIGGREAMTLCSGDACFILGYLDGKS